MTTALSHEYTPRGAAQDLFNTRDSEVLLCGPAGTGKSRACLEKIDAMCWATEGCRALIVRKTAASLAASGLQTLTNFVINESLAAGHIRFYGGSASEPAQYRYANGSRVFISGMDKAEKVMSTEYDVIYVQEATELSEIDWQKLTTRLRHGRLSFQQIIADCNPSHPTHWLKRRTDIGITRMLHSRHEDNPLYFDEAGNYTSQGIAYIEGVLDKLTGVEYQRLRKGEWAAAEGMIYTDWDSSAHVVKPFKIPHDWTRYWAVDFGYTNPFVLQFWAEDPDGILYLYREIYHTNRLVEDHARQALSLVKSKGAWIEPKPNAILCDHDAEGRATLKKELGLSTKKAKKEVKNGIQAVATRLKQKRIAIFDDALVERDPHLFNAVKPTCTKEEIPGYVWAETASGEQKEEPLKVNDHGADAMRYMVAHRDLTPKPNIRWF